MIASEVILLSIGPTVMKASMEASFTMSPIWSVENCVTSTLSGSTPDSFRMTRKSVTFTLVRPTTPTRWPGKSPIALIFDLAPLRGAPFGGPLAHSTTTFLRRMATELGAVGHLLIRARDREVGLLRGEHGDAVDGARGLHHGEPHGGALARKVLGQPLDQLQVAAVRGPDGDSQGCRPHDDEGGADRGGKQQQAGGEHQQRGTAVLAASGRNIVRRGQAV